MNLSTPLSKAFAELAQESAGNVEPSEKLKTQDAEVTPALTEELAESGQANGKVYYLPEVYDAQKDIGTRSKTGANNLKKLKPKHKRIIALHLSGWSNNAIAKKLNYDATYISVVINDPSAQDIIAKFDELHEEEFKRLRILANETLRVAMQPDKPDSTKLAAARTFYKRETDMDLRPPEQTAEDVMQNILQKIEAENVQINIINPK